MQAASWRVADTLASTERSVWGRAASSIRDDVPPARESATAQHLADAAGVLLGQLAWRRRRWPASAQTRVTGSSGSGRARTQPSSWSTFTPSTSSSGPVLRQLDEAPHHRALLLPRGDDRLDRPGAASGSVGHDVGQLGAGAGEQLEQLHERGGGVEGGQEAGEDVAAVEAGGEADARPRWRRPSAPASTASSTAPRRRARPTMVAACDVHATGRATRSPSRWPDTRRRKASSAWVWVRTWPGSSTSVRCSPSGSMTAPTWAPEACTRAATLRGVGGGVVLHGPDGRRRRG